MTTLEVAIKLRDGGPMRRDCGICLNLREQDRGAYGAFKVFLCASDYDEAYPVEVDLMGMGAEEADAYYMDCDDKWVGAYGAARMRLLEEFINWLRVEE